MISLTQSPCDKGVIRGADKAGQCAERAKPWVLAATILGSSMAFIDGSVVNVALPAIQKDLSTSLSRMQWVVNGYMLMLASLILVGGAAGDRFGRRLIFMLGIALFALASIWCGLAGSAGMLIAARMAQGVAGALMIPSSLAIISASFDHSERGKAIGTWAGFSAIAAAIGPVLGGALVDALSWRAIFFINVPLAIGALAITLRFVPESRAEQANGRLDWSGALLAALGLGGLTYALIGSSELGWGEPKVIGGFVASVVLLSGFILNEARRAAPMLPLKLFRSPTFAGANLMTLMLYAGLGGSLFFLPFNLIQVQGYSATAAGAAFLPFTIIMGGFSRWSGALMDRIGRKPPLIVGPLITAGGLALLAVPTKGGMYWSTFFPPIVVLGIGMVIAVAPLTTTVINAVEDRYSSTASGVNNAVSRIASLLAVAVLGVVAVAVFESGLDDQLAHINAPIAAEQTVRENSDQLAAVAVPEDVPADMRQALRGAIDAAFVSGFRAVMLTAAGLALLAAGCAAVLIQTENPAASTTGADSTSTSGG